MIPSILPREHHLIAMAVCLTEKGLPSLCEHVRDLLITYYVNQSGRIPGQPGRITSCYFDHMRTIECEWNKRHLEVIVEAKRRFKIEHATLKERDPYTYSQLKLRHVHDVEKRCVLTELRERFGKVFYGPVALREYKKSEGGWKRSFTTDRWLQVLLNQTQSGESEKKRILETIEDYDLFRDAAFPSDSAESIYQRTVKKSAFRFFAERAILHFQSSEMHKQALIIGALIRTYVAFQSARNGPIERFVDLLPRENLGRSRIDSSKIIVGVQDAPKRIAHYSQRIEQVVTDTLPMQLPSSVSDKIEEIKKSTNQFYNAISEAAKHLTAFLALLPEDDAVSCYKGAYMAANEAILKIDAVRKKEIEAGGFPLTPREKRLAQVAEEMLFPETAFLLSLVQNNGIIDFITSVKNLIYSFSGDRPSLEKSFAKNLYMQPLSELELANNRKYEKRLLDIREKYEAEYEEKKLVLSKVLVEEDKILFEEGAEIFAQQEQERHELDSRRKGMAASASPPGLAQIYGHLQLKIDPVTYTKRRWLQLFLNRETGSDEELQRTRDLIDNSDDIALMLENFSLQGSHTPLGKFAAGVFEYVALKARRILDEYSSKPLPVKKASLFTKLTRSFSKLSVEQETIASQFPESSRKEYVQTIITDAQLTCLASLHYIRQELLKMRRNAFDQSLDCSVDGVSKVGSKEALDDYQAIQASLTILCRETQPQRIDEGMISIVNVQKEGISRAFLDLATALDRMIQFLQERVKYDESDAIKDYIQALNVAYTNIIMIRDKIV